MDRSVKEWTWEVCMFHLNQTVLESLLEIRKEVAQKYEKNIHDLCLYVMLKKKVETAYRMLQSGKVFQIPKYVQEAFRWVSA